MFSSNEIDMEVEHELFLAQVELHDTGETETRKLTDDEWEEIVREDILHGTGNTPAQLPIIGVTVTWVPRYQAIKVPGLLDAPSAYRPLTKHRVLVGLSSDTDELIELVGKAKGIALEVPDPTEWKGEGM